ncbi:hypothetical protein OH77DRAFT_1454050 [Trametes cingulata]|nr:hypothetical protein OH77DRAFT_1454050 [Trametes cingulata]
MRQRGMSVEDQRFRRALTNLRVKSCTEDDRALFRSRIIAQGSVRGLACDWSKYEDVSIITARNSHRDAINEVGSRLFALRRGERLHAFRSVDRWSSAERNEESVRQDQRETVNSFDPVRRSDEIHPDIQAILWDIPPCMTDHHAGTLRLCKGMPVILKNNEATEICATNGAEGVVYDWKAHLEPSGEEVLDVLFVRLTDPPKTVQIEGLPANVVPVVRTKNRVKCVLPTGVRYVYIDREQVMVLPNFAMSDFASQGRTRKYNPCHLRYCRTSQSLYTCLSRCSSLDGTIIVGGFDENKMVGGLPRALKREFLDFEILDDIVKREYEGTLPEGIPRTYRSEAIRVFLSKMGESYMPPYAHPALDWPTYKANPRDDVATPWRIVSKRRVKKPKKRKRTGESSADDGENGENRARKRPRFAPRVTCRDAAGGHSRLSGFIWDSENWSCAYDSLLTVLWNIYEDDRDGFVANMAGLTVAMDTLIACFNNVNREMSNLEGQRDAFRNVMAEMDGLRFPRSGACLIAVSDIVDELLRRQDGYGYRASTCMSCGRVEGGMRDHGRTLSSGLLYVHSHAENGRSSRSGLGTFSSAVKETVAGEINGTCRHCGGSRRATLVVERVPSIICVELYPASGGLGTQLDRSFSVEVNGLTRYWTLRGLIYWGGNHFTCRYLDRNGMVWYHDGVSCGRDCKPERLADEMNLLEANRRGLSHLIYYSSQ